MLKWYKENKTERCKWTFSLWVANTFLWVVFIRAEEYKICQAIWLQQAERYEENHRGGYRQIYPSSDSDKYNKFFQHNNSLFQETAASRAREEYAR